MVDEGRTCTRDPNLRMAHAHHVTTVVPMTHPFQEVRGEFRPCKVSSVFALKFQFLIWHSSACQLYSSHDYSVEESASSSGRTVVGVCSY